MPNPWTWITHQHNGNPYRLPTQHTTKFNRNDAKDGSIWLFTLGRWHGAQLYTWSFHVWSFQLSNNNTLKSIICCTYKITCLIVISKIINQCCLLQVHIISQFKAMNLMLISSSLNNGILKCIIVLRICQILHNHGHYQYKIIHYLNAWSHIFGSSKLLMVITSRWIEGSSLSSQSNSKKYGEKNVWNVFQLNLYPIVVVDPNL